MVLREARWEIGRPGRYIIGAMTHDFDRVVERRGTGSSKWFKYPSDVLPLWVADMDFASPEPVIRALRERVEHGVFGYGHQLEVTELNEIFADRLQKRYGWRVPPDAVLPIPGVIPGFNVACRMLTAPGQGILMQTPLYPPLLRVPGNLGLRFDEVPLARDGAGRYSVDQAALEATIKPDTRVLLLCNPHNPVGRVFTREELSRLAEVCLKRGLAIVADEIHCDLVFSGLRHVPIASLDEEIAARTVTLMAPSKTFNLAGLKCSVAIIPDQALRERFIAARVDMVQTVNILGYTAALAAYRDGQPWLDDLLRYLEANRDFLGRFVRAAPGGGVNGGTGGDVSRVARLSGGRRGGPRPIYVLLGASAGSHERRGLVRQERSGLRAAQLRMPTQRSGAGPRSNARCSPGDSLSERIRTRREVSAAGPGARPGAAVARGRCSS